LRAAPRIIFGFRIGGSERVPLKHIYEISKCKQKYRNSPREPESSDRFFDPKQCDRVEHAFLRAYVSNQSNDKRAVKKEQ
jgi:hypothetical protein